MLYQIMSIIGVILLIVGFALIFKRVRSAGAAAFDDEEPADELPVKPEEEDGKDDADKEKNIFSSVDVSNTQDATGFGYESNGQSMTKNLSFEDTIGKEKVIVEIPAPKAKKRSVKAPAKPVVKKGSPVKLGATPEELVEILSKKIAKRVDVLKVAKLPESGDATLKRLRSNLQKVKDKMAEAAAAKKPAKKATAKKVSKEAEDEVIVVNTPRAPARKPAKKAPAKKPARKTTRKATKKTK